MSNHFRIQVGNTERQVDSIVKNIRKADLPIEKVKWDNSNTDEIFIDISLANADISEDELKRSLNEYGGCMYQVISVRKIQE